MLGLEEDVIEDVEEEACQEALEENGKRGLKRKSPKCHACQQKRAFEKALEHGKSPECHACQQK